MILLTHFAGNGLGPGQLHDTVQQHKTNDYLRQRYYALHQAGALPNGLLPPVNNPNQDATNFEAWIFQVFEATNQDHAATAAQVLPALAVA